MLRRLALSNLTIFERAELQLDAGLTVITGETGAGKTVITQALSMVCGADVDSSFIGPYRDEGYAEAEFDTPPPSEIADLAENENEFVLARRLRVKGTRALVDGRSAAAGLLRQASTDLIALTGQHAAQRLVDPVFQREMLDGFGDYPSTLERVSRTHQEISAARRALQQAREALTDADRRQEMLRNAVDFVREIEPNIGEDDELEVELTRLTHADELTSSVLQASHLISGEDDHQATDLIAQAARMLERSGEHDPELAALGDEVSDLSERLTEVARTLRDMSERYEADPERLEQVQSRLGALRDLRRRYNGQSLEQILEQTDRDEEDLRQFENADQHLAELETAITTAGEAYVSAAAELTLKRSKAAPKLAKATERHLRDLGLSGAKLHVSFPPTDGGSVYGDESVVFALQANAGLPPAPLNRGASGGELSRVNLALMLATQSTSQATLIFDEVDAGIGGQVAHILGQKISDLAKQTQVIVITHLAQIAVHADQHFIVEKKTARGQTAAKVRELGADERDYELARLSGVKPDEAQEAAQMMRRAAGLA